MGDLAETHRMVIKWPQVSITMLMNQYWDQTRLFKILFQVALIGAFNFPSLSTQFKIMSHIPLIPTGSGWNSHNGNRMTLNIDYYANESILGQNSTFPNFISNYVGYFRLCGDRAQYLFQCILVIHDSNKANNNCFFNLNPHLYTIYKSLIMLPKFHILINRRIDAV